MDKLFDIASVKDDYDVVIIGGGAAGCSAAMYTSRDELSTLVIERIFPGGQMGLTAHIDNHPGIPETIIGTDMAERYYKQAVRFGAAMRHGNVVDMVAKGDLCKEIHVEGWEKPVKAKVVIIATGSSPRKLDVPGETKFWGRGVSTCATCDGGFYRDKVVVCVGGGNTALNESVYLTRFAKKVYLIHRRDEFRGTKLCQRAVFDNPNIELVLDSAITEINGDATVESVSVKNLKTGEIRDIKTDGVFTFIGQCPSVEPFNKYLKTDEEGFIITNESMETEIKGVYAAGDIRSKEFRQIAIATGEGVIAAQKAAHFLQEMSFVECMLDEPAE